MNSDSDQLDQLGYIDVINECFAKAHGIVEAVRVATNRNNTGEPTGQELSAAMWCVSDLLERAKEAFDELKFAPAEPKDE